MADETQNQTGQAPPLPPGFAPVQQQNTPSAPPLPPGFVPVGGGTQPTAAPPQPAPKPEVGFWHDPEQYADQNPDETRSKVVHGMKTAQDVLKDITIGPTVGLLKGAGGTMLDADKLIRHVLRGVGAPEGTDLPQFAIARGLLHKIGVTDEMMQDAVTAKNPGETVGKVGENVLEFMAGDEVLKGLTMAEKYNIIAKTAKMLEEYPVLAKLAEHGLNSMRQGLVGGGQALLHGASAGEAAVSGLVTGGTAAAMEGITAGASALKKAITGGGSAGSKAVTETAADTIAQGKDLKPAGEDIAKQVDQSPTATTYPRNADEAQTAIKESQGTQGKPLAEAGKRVQSEAQAVKDVKGKELGAAKEKLAESLPEHFKTDEQYQEQAFNEIASQPDRGFQRNPFSDKKFEDLTPEQQERVLDRAKEMKTAETGQIPFPKDGAAVENINSIVDELGEEKLGLKDPNNPLGKLANRLKSGKNPDGTDLSFSFDDAQNSRKALSGVIKSEYAKMQAGGDGTLYHRLVGLKTAFDEDLYNTWEKYGDAAQAQKVRELGREYYKIINDQYMGPAKRLFKTQSPEAVISNIVSGGAKQQSAVESILKNTATDEGRQVFRDSVEREIYRRATKADGTIDAQKAVAALTKMGDTGKLIFGGDYQGMVTFLGDAAKKQAETGVSTLTASELENPEQIVHNLVSGGAKEQSKVEGLVSQLSDAGRETLRDSSLKEMYRRSTLPNGDIDMAGARDAFRKMGEAGKAMFGDKYDEVSQFLDAAAKQQEAKQAAADKLPLYKRVGSKFSKMAGAGAGAAVGSVFGAAAGAEAAGDLADAVFQTGKSGAVKVGISPTEQVVLSPAQVVKARPKLTAFLQAVQKGDKRAIVAAYNAINIDQGESDATPSTTPKQ